jgi:hypothetical protein
MRLDQRQNLGPRDHLIHLAQKAFPARHLALLLPGGRREGRLLHRYPLMKATAHCTQYPSLMTTCAELP